MPAPEKTKWEKIDIILKPVGGLMTALAVAAVGFFGSRLLEAQQATQTNARLYAELMSAREESDSLLRQEMFKTIINDFLAGPATGGGEPKDFAREVLRLEVLAYNFHDALDLAPLFKDVHRRLVDPDNGLKPTQQQRYLERLRRVAKEVIDKQVAVLEESGAAARASVDFEQLDATGYLPQVIYQTLRVRDQARGLDTESAFAVDVIGVARDKREVTVRLTVWPGGNGEGEPIGATFAVGFFDFPMIDNTRVLGGERCAVVLKSFQDFAAEIALVYFPASRASLKEKPYYEEVIEQLRPLATAWRRDGHWSER